MKWIEKIVYLLVIAFSIGIIAAQSITLAEKYRDLFFDSRAGFLDRYMVNDFLPLVIAFVVCVTWLFCSLGFHNFYNKQQTFFTFGWLIIRFIILPIILVSVFSSFFNLYIENTTFNLYPETAHPLPRDYGEWRLSLAGDFLVFYQGGFFMALSYILLKRQNKTT